MSEVCNDSILMEDDTLIYCRLGQFHAGKHKNGSIEWQKSVFDDKCETELTRDGIETVGWCNLRKDYKGPHAIRGKYGIEVFE